MMSKHWTWSWRNVSRLFANEKFEHVY